MMLNEERGREAGAWPAVEPIWREARYAVRRLSRSPGFTLTVILTLALAVGANTAIFSVVNALLLQRLPYPEPDRIGTIYASGTVVADARRNLDGEQWEMLRDDVPSLASAVYRPSTSGVNLQSESHAQYVQEGRVSSHYFDVLGISPAIGRAFSEDEDRPQGPKVVVLSHAVSRTVFDEDTGVIGRTVMLKGEPHTVIGVLSQDATTPLRADVYTALQPSREGEGQAGNFAAIVRLRDGATWVQASAEINRAWANTARTRLFEETYRLVPFQAAVTEALRPQVLSLMLAAGVILLIACANLAALTLVRILRRRDELSTRLALGASSWRIQRQLWIENLLLALVGAAPAVGVGALSLHALLALLPENFLPVAEISLDGRVLGFTLAVSLFTALLFGVLPALAMKVDLRSSMSSRTVAGAGSVRVRQGLIVGEVALTVVLLAAAGLLIRTLIHLETLPPGFDPAGVVAGKASLNDARYTEPAAFRTLLDESIAAMQEIPGVESAAVALSLPYERPVIDAVALPDGPRAGQLISTNEAYVTPAFFSTLRIPLIAGRSFSDADGPNAQRVVIVNQTFARKFLGEANPVGRQLVVGPSRTEMLIVGIAGDTLLSSAGQLNVGSAPVTREEMIYLPAAQATDGASLSRLHTFLQPSWIVRTAAPAEGLPAQMQSALTGVDPSMTFSGFYSMADLMATTLGTQRIEAALLTAMAFLALSLSAVGIFGLVMSIVTQRTREIGIRMALGSTITKTMLHVAGSGAGASMIGGVLGLMLCAGVLRVMRSVVYGVEVYDAATILVVVLGMSAVTLLATVVPARRIGRIDPATILRDE